MYSHHQAAELELPFENTELEALKFAHQTTLADEPFYKNGYQVFGEIFLKEEQTNKRFNLKRFRLSLIESISKYTYIEGCRGVDS